MNHRESARGKGCLVKDLERQWREMSEEGWKEARGSGYLKEFGECYCQR